MAPVPLFTRFEMQAAFGLILPATTARAAAEQWWEQFADDVDQAGRYLYEDPLMAAGITPAAQGIATAGTLSSAEQRNQEELFWGGNQRRGAARTLDAVLKLPFCARGPHLR